MRGRDSSTDRIHGCQFGSPKVMQPRTILETLRPELPRLAVISIYKEDVLHDLTERIASLLVVPS